MQNIDLEVTDNNKLILVVDLDVDIAYTRSHRSVRIASSEGNLQIWYNGKPHPKGVKVNLNVFRGLTQEEKEEVAKARKAAGYYR